MSDPAALFLAALAVAFIGVSKAGFGGGLGMLTTPMCVLALSAMGHSPVFVLGFLLPLLIAGDAFSLWHYRGKGDWQNLRYLLPGIILGVVVGSQLIGRFEPRVLNIVIGSLALIFVVFQFTKDRILKAEGVFSPNHKIGLPFGLATGITSSFAHGAGPIITMYLVPQKHPKEKHVATRVLIFTFVNWIKVPFFVAAGAITGETLWASLKFLPLVPVGVWFGVMLNRRFSEAAFMNVIYILTLLAGVQLIFEFRPFDWFR